MYWIQLNIDADHNIPAIKEQFELTKAYATPNCYYIFDDYEEIRSYVDSLIENKILAHIESPWCLWTNTITQRMSCTDSHETGFHFQE